MSFQVGEILNGNLFEESLILFGERVRKTEMVEILKGSSGKLASACANACLVNLI